MTDIETITSLSPRESRQWAPNRKPMRTTTSAAIFPRRSDLPKTLEIARLTRKAGKAWKAAGISMMTAPIVPMKEASSGGDGAKGVDNPTGG